MPDSGTYVPSPWDWVREQVEEYEASGGTRANTLLDTGMPIIVLMRVEHGGGEYALVASKGGTPQHPEWYHNLVAHPHDVLVQDGPTPFSVLIREATGDDRTLWWERSVAAYPPYADYQAKTERQIPVFIAARS